jgi:hypothetical protein
VWWACKLRLCCKSRTSTSSLYVACFILLLIYNYDACFSFCKMIWFFRLLGGPFLALIFGFGAAYAAQQDEGVLGDSARAVGDVALAASVKAREIDDKHRVVERAKVAGTRALEKAAELDQKHGIVEKTSNAIVVAWNKTREFVVRHRLIERGINGIGRGVYWLAQKINESSTTHRARQELRTTMTMRRLVPATPKGEGEMNIVLLWLRSVI